MWRWLICSLMIIACYSAPRCGVTRELEEKAHAQLMENHAHGRHLVVSRGSTLSPIRIYFHYSLDAAMTTAQQDELKNFLMPAVSDYFKKVLRVYPLLNNLVLPSSATDCYEFPIPSAHKTTGIPNADLLVYVTAYNANENTVAWAVACQQDVAPAYNVIAGRININMYHFGSSMTTGTKVSVLLHEMTHLLGFSNYLFSYFHKPNGAFYTTDERTAVITQRGKQVTIAKFPTVVSKARAAFGCSTLQGLELEDQGGSGTAGSHWEKMLMHGDFMQGDTGADDWVFSDITFALLEDSGWYSVDYSQTDSIVWGKNAGCSFFTNKCVSNGVATSSYFCASDAESCTKNRNAKGFCNIAQYSGALPSYFQYFSDPTKGANDNLMDYCPVVDAYSNGDCRGLGSKSTSVQTLWGEQVCLNCKCFDSDMLDNRYTSQAGVIQVCYKVRCDTATSKFYVTVGSVEKECPSGSKVTFTGYNGSISCGRYEDVCTNLTCPNFCLKRGQCVSGACQCDTGYGGDFCQTTCHATCKNCSGTASNQCTTCRTGETLSNGTCSCPAGTTRNSSGECGGSCNALCKTCSGTCSACIANAQLVSGSTTNCECRSGFTLVNGSCVAVCQGLCETCSPDNGATCLSCKVNSTFGNSACTCNSGYVQSGSQCLPCSLPCLSCSSSQSFCTSCVTNATLSASAGICTCNSGYTLNSATGKCELACNSLCQTCTNGVCTTCKANAKVVSGSTNNCECAQGFTLSNGACVAICQGLCATCSANSATTCLTCLPNSTLANGVCTCNSGFQLSSGTCVPVCSVSCLTCSTTNGSICTSCKENAALSSAGVCTCNSGYTMNSATGKCELACNSLCQTCSGGVCTTCKANAKVVSTSTNNCECAQGFTLSNGACVAVCQGLCATCSPNSGSSCLSCKSNSTLANGVCTCNAGFQLSGSDCIVACSPSCKSCSSTSGLICTDCKVNATLSSSGVCTCNSGYVMNTATGDCNLGCNSLCQTCSNGVCTTCKTNATVVLGSTNNCECKQGFTLSNGACVAVCQGLCLTCSANSGTTCLTCQPNSTLANGVCTCNSGFQLVNGRCVAVCNNSCVGCSETNGNICLSCKFAATLSSAGACTCNSGYVMNTTNGNCELACNSLCTSCIKGVCTACKDNATVYATNTNNCECKLGFTLSNGACVAVCQGLCATCSANSGTTCLTCKPNSNLANGVCTCKTGFQLINDQCVAICNNSCATCSATSGTTCLTCKENATLSSAGACNCNAGYVRNTTTGNCDLACNTLCQTCASGVCSACKSNASVVSGSTNNCECKQGFTLTNGACVAVCQGLCATCNVNSGTTCLTCKANSTLANGACTCKAGFVYNSSTATCVAECNSLCTTCNPSTGCTACTSNSSVVSITTNPSLCTCKAGFQPSGSECVAVCANSCATCSKTVATSCLTCKDNATLTTSNTCVCNSGFAMNTATGNCSLTCNSLCQTCSSGVCTTCKANALVVLGSTNNCECKQGFNLSNGACVAVCQGLCATCSAASGTTCLTCKPNSTLSNGTCNCRAGFAYDSATATCKASCNALCQTCNDSTGCTACVTGARVTSPTTNPSVCGCSTGFTQSGSECVAICSNTCATCSKTIGTTCLTCKDNATLQNEACVCNSGYVLNSATGVCELGTCPQECTGCVKGSHKCTGCKSGFFFWPEVETCYASCPSGFTASNGQCASNTAAVFDFNIDKYTTSYTSGAYTLTGNSVKALYKRGWAFSTTSSATLTGPLVLGPNHYISLWVRPTASSSPRTLVSKYAGKIFYKLTLSSTNAVQLTINTESFNDSYTPSTQTLDFGTITTTDWSNIVLIFTFSKPNTSIAFYNKNSLKKTLSVSTGFFEDYSGSDSTFITLGAHYDGSTYTERFSGFIARFTAGNNSSFRPTISNNCFTSSYCLINCNSNQFFTTTCSTCQSSCADGCIRGTDCRLNEDPMCTTFTDYVGCTQCTTLATLNNGKCSCVENATYSATNSVCACNSNFRENGGKCVGCKNYYKSTEVTARFGANNLSVIVTFSRAATTFTSNACSNFINTTSLAKLGTSPTCAWNSARTILTITLGRSPTITTEALSIRELNVVAAGSTSTCTFTPETLAPVIGARVSKVEEEEIIGEYLDPSEEENGEDCETNLAPGIIMMATFGVYLVMCSIFSFFTKSAESQNILQLSEKKYESVPEPQEAVPNVIGTTISEITERNTTPQVLDISLDGKSVEVSRNGENNVTKIVEASVLEVPQMPVVSKRFFQLFKEQQVLNRIAKSQFVNVKRYLLFTILSSLVLQYTLLGAFYSAFQNPKAATELYTGIEVIENYSGKDLGYVILALVVSLPVSCLMQYKLNSYRGYLLGLVVLAGSLAGSIYMMVEYCHRDAGLWAMGCVLSCATELGLGQNVTAIMAALVAKARNH